MHWVLVVQAVMQTPSSQVDGLQEIATPTMQVPSPSQTLGGTNLSRPSQAPSLHTVPCANLAQPPWPLQKPLWPQVSGESSRQTSCGSSAPAGTGAHSPMRSGWLQLTQAPVHSTLQQTPSAQKFEARSLG